MSCPVCGGPVVDTKRGQQKYCSVKCSIAAKVAASMVERPIDKAIRSGMSAPQIARAYLVDDSVVYLRAKRLGLKCAPSKESPAWFEKALALHAKGRTNQEIACHCGVKRGAVWALLKRRGLSNNAPERAKRTATGPRPAPGMGPGRREPKQPALWGTDMVFDGPVVEKVYRVLSGAKVDILRGGGRCSGGKVEFETTDSYQAFRFIEGRKGFIKTDETNMVLAYGTGKKVLDV